MVDNARPKLDPAILRTMTQVRNATAKIQKKLVMGIASVKPVAPPTDGTLRMMTRMISPKPRVTIAR